MDLRDYMKSMNENTVQGKNAPLREDNQDRPSIETHSDNKFNSSERPSSAETQYSPVLLQLKKDFALVANQISINPPRIIDIPTATDQAVELKRRGEYVESNRYYANYLPESVKLI